MESKRRYLVTLMGIVQGVGYRPFVYNLATLFHITGWVSNQGAMLVMDVEGEKENMKSFLFKLIKEPPKLAVINKVNIIKDEYIGYEEFKINPSKSAHQDTKFISYDVSTCSDCLNDILDSTKKRYHYPFTNCTSCGPRYTIIKKLPYDRVSTTMEQFQMCLTCQAEYDDPTNRRFHAQPNCCPKCGPNLKLMSNKGEEIVCEDVVSETVKQLKNGHIIAIKGLGGFHLACDAMNEKSIDLLRKRKKRPHKPFAIMIKDLNLIKKISELSQEEEKILESCKAPIVILKKKSTCSLPNNIAPHINSIGVMLPYTPLHHLLFEGEIKALVMTSANISLSPIQFDNNQVIETLHNIADFFLIHNRDIHLSIEDSVVKVMNQNEMVIRRARGYSPYSLNLRINNEILALGSEEKGNFSFSQNGYGYLSQYLGDLKDYDTYAHYVKVIDHFKKIMGIDPAIIAHDLQSEPIYSGIKYVQVQHHHAHMVSCMVEHGLNERVIGVIFDGTGLGTDGTIWGGEILIGNREIYTRVGHFKNVLIQGGDTAIRDIRKIAFSYLYAMDLDPKEWISSMSDLEIEVLNQALENKLNCYHTSSVGRLFDCVSVLLDVCHQTSYQAQGAIELESILNPNINDTYTFKINENEGIFEIGYQEIIRGVLNDIETGIPYPDISTKFHNSIGIIIIHFITKMSNKYHINDVVLSGGVFENNYLLSYILNKTKDSYFNIYYNQEIPINDGGISIGQLAITAALERKCGNVHSHSG